MSPFLILLLIVSMGHGGHSFDKGTSKHVIVSYLGGHFVVADGCPTPRCFDSRSSVSECLRLSRLLLALYEQCVIGSERGRHLGCFTDVVADGRRLLTLPKYSSLCSAMCHEKDPRRLTHIHACPHRGRVKSFDNQQRLLATAGANFVGKI